MQIRLLNNKDITEIENYLAPYQAECMFICSNLEAAGVEYHDADFHGKYIGHFNNDSKKLNGIIVHYWNGNVMVHTSDLSILKDLTHHLKNNIEWPISGILGPNIQVELVIKHLGLSNALYNINCNEGLYEIDLKNLNETSIPPGFNIVKAKEVPKSILIEWRKAYNIEALGATNNSELKKLAEQDCNRLLLKNDCSVLLNDRTPVAMSGFNARLKNIIQVGSVWTPHEYRNRGFAKMLLSNILSHERNKEVKKAILFTDNQAAIKVYQFIGFKKIGSYRLALLQKQI